MEGNKYYLGLDYFVKRNESLTGCLSWEAEKTDYYYTTEEAIEAEILEQYKAEYNELFELEFPEYEDMAIYSVEIQTEEIDPEADEIEEYREKYDTIKYYMPPQKMCDILGVNWAEVFNKLQSTGKEIVVLTNDILEP